MYANGDSGHRPLWRRLWRAFLWIAFFIVLATSIAWYLSRPDAPDAFYAAPTNARLVPGALLRNEPFARDVPANARGWRILYATTRGDGSPAVASALVLAPKESRSTPRGLIAWTHGTTGAATGCAPSLLEHPFANMPGLSEALAAGWVIVATDYVGQGTAGQHPYLIGEGEARSALDSIRAVRAFSQLEFAPDTVVWGHSQGGHAALWTGALAPTYAAELHLVGVAAAAPASDLKALVDANQHAPVGRIMSSYILRAYAADYADVRPAELVASWKLPLVNDIAAQCLAGKRALFSVGEALALGGSIWRIPPTQGALAARLEQNTPRSIVPSPLFIAQGETDELVLPEIQRAYVRERCAAGQALEYRSYAGRDHLSVVAADSPYVADLIAWTRARFATQAAANTCASLD
ncbi:lipase family protein [Arenimonas sp.]|uniref:lipase family protein n=1 Tax=Arenimonas sp. TaxID=1872635 RepID=UPI0039E2E80C